MPTLPPSLPPSLPKWAQRMRRAYRSGSASQFILYGNVTDLVSAPPKESDDKAERRYLSLRRFLTGIMFEPFDVVLHYDRGRGIRAKKGSDHFQGFLKAFDTFRGTSWSKPTAGDGDKSGPLALANMLPRDAGRALELIDRFLRASQQRTEASESSSGRVPAPLKVAVVVDYAHFIVPRGEPIHQTSERAQTLIRLLDWASDPAITEGAVATVLITENLTDLNRLIVESPYSTKIKIDLPRADSLGRYVHHLTGDDERFDRVSEVSRELLAAKLVGLSRVNVRTLLLEALGSDEPLTLATLTEVKKRLIEKEAAGRIEFIEPNRTLDNVAGHHEAKAWLRQDAALLKKGRLRAIPMGYLLCGRIGTGKTFLVHCWAGEVGIPVVEITNFRERWVGASEGNLERIFTILHALGQVVVFIDEADQATGKRDAGSGDSGLSGRIYGMLAKEMSDTANRGKILWVLATSRPDLLEVDLKRQGRLDVHIPLFPPGDAESRHELFAAMARKVGLGVDPEHLPTLPDNDQIGGNEMEGILVRALRLYETQAARQADQGSEAASAGVDEAASGEAERSLPEIIAEVIADVRPSAHVERLTLMDLVAVKECTDSRFLPERYRELSLSDINRRIEQLRLVVGE